MLRKPIEAALFDMDGLLIDTEAVYVEALQAPGTINTLPEKTIHAFADHGNVVAPIPRDGVAC